MGMSRVHPTLHLNGLTQLDDISARAAEGT
jgi:hypothetical protein